MGDEIATELPTDGVGAVWTAEFLMRYPGILLDIDGTIVDGKRCPRAPVGIAASAKSGEVRGLLRAATVADLIDYTTSSDVRTIRNAVRH
jgi:hypothetical protein